MPIARPQSFAEQVLHSLRVLWLVGSQLPSQLSNRDLAIATWAALTMLFLLLRDSQFGVLKSLLRALGALFSRSLIPYIVAVIAYCGTMVWLLHEVGMWNATYLKDTIVWFTTTVCLMFYRTTDLSSWRDFGAYVKDVFKLTTFTAFVVDYYTFSYPVELVLTFLVLFFSLMSVISRYEGAVSVVKLSAWIVNLVVISFVGNAVYSIAFSSEPILTLRSAQAVAMPIALTSVYLPFAYLLALILNYDTIIRCILYKEKKLSRRIGLISAMFKKCGVSLERVNSERKNLKWYSE